MTQFITTFLVKRNSPRHSLIYNPPKQWFVGVGYILSGHLKCFGNLTAHLLDAHIFEYHRPFWNLSHVHSYFLVLLGFIVIW